MLGVYLRHRDCTLIRSDGSHHKWKCPNCLRSIIFWDHKKVVPRFHIDTCLKTLEEAKKEFNAWVKKDCSVATYF